MPNALSAERSLYLRQHADNPVAWVPWSNDVFARAAQEDKLVFVSVGYAACHWCHVMERESFEDDEVAALLNRWFIPVKVDRQERPDLDSVFMSICQAMTGHGGWPLTIIMTPDKNVLFAGTYFPKRSTSYRIGLIELLERIHTLWVDQRQDVIASARELMQRVEPYLCAAESGAVDSATYHRAVELLSRSFDAEYGGFGHQPKFPMASTLWFLLIWSVITKQRTALTMATRTLDAMRWGGIWDHVGLGFHRYSTDRKWFLPHFEKMLYDQALLMMVYGESAAITGNELHRRTAMEIAAYMEQNLLLDCGAYAASEDADTLDGEGAYYQWQYNELFQIVPNDDCVRVCRVFGVVPDGNAHDEATGQSTGRNILYAGTETNRVLETFGGSLEEFFAWWEPHRKRLLEYRKHRRRPARDEQILCEWNALAIVGLARCGRLLLSDTLIERAERCWHYIETVHRLPDGGLAHSSYDGVRGEIGFLDDHALSAWALLELYQSTGTVSYLDRAIELVDFIAAHFTSDDGLLLNTRQRDMPAVTEPSDGATVSAVAITALVEATLGLLTSHDVHRNRAERIIERYGSTISTYPATHTTFLVANLAAHYGQVLTVDLNKSDRNRLWNILARQHWGLRTVAHNFRTDQSEPQAILCTPSACSSPALGWDEIERTLIESLPVFHSSSPNP